MQKRVLGAAGALLAVMLGVAHLFGAQADNASSTDEDYYLLALSWLPTWCAQTGDAREARQCDTNAGWVVHGLWPQYAAGGWPEYCQTEARDPSRAQTAAMADIMGDGGLAWHQWKKHGRCSGLTAQDYFSATRTAFERLDWPADLVRVNRAQITDPDSVESAFRAVNPEFGPDMMMVTCRDGDLTEIRLCLGQDLQPRRCDADTLARSCRARQVTLPAHR
jgi:ribonuclease T2